MELGIDILAMLFAAAFIAAFIDAIAGGGGLITIPALLMTGMPPAMALGTNKLQAFGGALSASIYFLRKSGQFIGVFFHLTDNFYRLGDWYVTHSKFRCVIN